MLGSQGVAQTCPKGRAAAHCTGLHRHCNLGSLQKSATMTLKLHTYPGNKNAFKALIAAQYVGVQIEVPPFNFGVDNKKPEFLKLNPNGKVGVPAGTQWQELLHALRHHYRIDKLMRSVWSANRLLALAALHILPIPAPLSWLQSSSTSVSCGASSSVAASQDTAFTVYCWMNTGAYAGDANRGRVGEQRNRSVCGAPQRQGAVWSLSL